MCLFSWFKENKDAITAIAALASPFLVLFGFYMTHRFGLRRDRKDIELKERREWSKNLKEQLAIYFATLSEANTMYLTGLLSDKDYKNKINSSYFSLAKIYLNLTPSNKRHEEIREALGELGNVMGFEFTLRRDAAMYEVRKLLHEEWEEFKAGRAPE